MEGHEEQPEIKTEPSRGIFQDFTCRLCLFRDQENIDLFDPLASRMGLIEKMSIHLSIEVTSEDEFPKWICKFCQRSLESFHAFHNKVSQIQESLSSMLAIVKKTSYNVGETPRLDEVKLEVLESTVGFRRTKTTHARCTPSEARQVRKITRRSARKRSNTSKMDKHQDDSTCGPIDSTNVGGTDKETNDVRQKCGKRKVPVLPDINIPPTSRPEPTQCLLPFDEEDASSLEDQDWVGKEFNFASLDDAFESENDTWTPPKPKKTYSYNKKIQSGNPVTVKLRKRKPPPNKADIDDNDLPDVENDEGNELSDISSKKTKILISATHGTLPKPRVPTESRKMMRAEINAMMVQFYGITCDICVKNSRTSKSATAQLAKYQTFEDLCAHMQEEHNDRGYVKCCNCTMREKKRAERHMLLHTKPGYLYKCNICGKQLGSQHSFRCHILLHLPNSERPYHCSHCDRGFVTRTDLVLHEQQHLPEEKRMTFTCDICGSRFGYESGLTMHKQRVHEKIRPHLCDICAKSFISRSDMERHRAQIHGNVKREQCKECGKWFKGLSILKSHMRRHRGALFECQFCDKKYTVRSSWRAHLLRHSDSKPHKCPHCEKSFKLPGTLKMHLNQHTGELPYSCPFCPKKFASSGNYYTHRKRMHSEEVAQLKEAQEASLAVSGLPSSTVPPANDSKSLSEVIFTSKEKISAQSKLSSEILSVSVVNNSPVKEKPHIIPNPEVLGVSKLVGAAGIISSSPTIVSSNGSVNPVGVSVTPVTFTIARGNNSLLMTPIGRISSNPSISTLPVAISSVLPTLPFRVLPNVSTSVKPLNSQACVPSGLTVVNLIQPVTAPTVVCSEITQEELGEGNQPEEQVISYNTHPMQ